MRRTLLSNIRLSHTASEMYKTCSYKWKLHYQDRLRSTKVGSALFFGLALDEAFNVLLLEKKKNLTTTEKELVNADPYKVFRKHFQHFTILGEKVDISQNECAEYFKSDLDLDLLSSIDRLDLTEFASNLDIELYNSKDIQQFCDQCQLLMKREIDTNSLKVYNYACWLSLLRKGEILVTTYQRDILPQIEEVFEIQKKVSLPDGNDELMGFIDFIGSFVDEPGVQYIVDNKTSSRPYSEDSVRTSTQLATYSEHEDNPNCAYIVVEKKLRKKEPRTRVQIIKDKIPMKLIDETFDNITEVFYGIKENTFEKHLDDCFQYGKRCSYYDYCRTGDLKNLKYLKESRDGKSNK